LIFPTLFINETDLSPFCAVRNSLNHHLITDVLIYL
jgi:hypothetical protein